MSRYLVEDTFLLKTSSGTTVPMENVKVYLFGFGTTPTTPAEPTAPTGTAVSGSFYDADSGGNTLSNPILTDSNGHWQAYFTTKQRLYVVYTSNNDTAVVGGTTRSIAFAKKLDVQDMTDATAAAGSGLTSLPVIDENDITVVSSSSVKVIGADIDYSSSEAILNFLGGFTRDYVIVTEPNGNYAAKRKDANEHLYEAADPIDVLQDIDDARVLAADSKGTSVACVGNLTSTTTSGLLINSDGFNLYGGGYSVYGDAFPAGLKMSSAATEPYSGGLGSTPFVQWHGNSGGIHNMVIDANNKAKKALYIEPTVASVVHGRHFVYETSLVTNGTDYTVDWKGDDGFVNGGEMRMGVGGDGTHGIAVWNMDGADINATNLHVHGSGKGASGRTLINSGQTSKFVCCHFESGNGNDSGWVVTAGAQKSYFTGCLFGHQEAGGEVIVSANSTFHATGCLFHCDTDLNATNTYDMIKLNAASSGLVMNGCNAFIAAAANNWRYAILNASTGNTQVIGNRLRAVTGAWDNAPMLHGGNTLESVIIPGNLPSTGGFVKTLTDGASVAVDCAAGDIQYLTSAASRGFANPTNIVSGSRVNFVLTNSAAAAITHTWGSKYKMRAGTGPTVAGGSTQLIEFLSHDGTNLYEVSRTDGDVS